MNPLFHTGFSISDSLKSVLKSVLIYETIISFVYRAKAMIKELSVINFEIAQMTVAADDAHALPDWFMVEVIRDLPRLVNTTAPAKKV